MRELNARQEEPSAGELLLRQLAGLPTFGSTERQRTVTRRIVQDPDGRTYVEDTYTETETTQFGW